MQEELWKKKYKFKGRFARMKSSWLYRELSEKCVMSLCCCQQVLSAPARTGHPQCEATPPTSHEGIKFFYLIYCPTRRTVWSSRDKSSCSKERVHGVSQEQRPSYLKITNMTVSTCPFPVLTLERTICIYCFFVFILLFFCESDSKVKFLLHVDSLKLNLRSWEKRSL